MHRLFGLDVAGRGKGKLCDPLYVIVSKHEKRRLSVVYAMFSIVVGSGYCVWIGSTTNCSGPDGC